MIVESGLDVPNANTMFVNRADHFGLAQLYQLRGRVGRSHRRAYCYLIVPDSVDPDAERRLQVLEHHTELGAGYRIALKDLEMRGAGNLLGAEQSGFVHAVGFDMYLRMLEETVRAAHVGRRGAEARSGGRHDRHAELPARRLRRVAGREDRRLQAAGALRGRRRRSKRCGPSCAIGSARFRRRPKRCSRWPNCGSLAGALGIEGILVRGDEARITFRDSAAPRVKGLSGGVSRRAVPGGGPPGGSAVAQVDAPRRRADARRPRPRASRPGRLAIASSRPLHPSGSISPCALVPSSASRLRCALLAACDGLKEALTAHVDVVARAGSQELSVNRLGDLLGNAKIQVPVTRETRRRSSPTSGPAISSSAYAAAHGDSLNDKKAIDVALAPIINAQKPQHFMDSVSARPSRSTRAARPRTTRPPAACSPRATSSSASRIRASRRPPAEKDSVRKKAEQVRAQVTPANFAEMAKKYSTDPERRAEQRQPRRLPEAAQMVARVLRRRRRRSSRARSRSRSRRSSATTSFSACRTPKRRRISRRSTRRPRRASPTARTWRSSRPTANDPGQGQRPATIKEAAKEPAKHRTDKATLATFKGGELTVADFLGWIETVPPQQQILQRIPQARRLGAQAVRQAGRAAAGAAQARRQRQGRRSRPKTRRTCTP